MGILGAKYRKGWCNIDPKELVFTFGGSYVCANFSENRSRNVTVRLHADGHTDRLLTDFIIYPMLYAIAMGQIKIFYSMKIKSIFCFKCK